MVIKVGVNGFGRIGRIIFRTCFEKSNIEISAINDPAVDIEYISYLMKFDSTHGKFNQDVAYSEDEIIINGEKIKVFREKLPSSIPWQTLGVQYVVEASGMFTTVEKASGHLASASVKRVIVTAPSVDVPMIILGVNEEQITKEHKVISCASSTLYCLAPMIKLLEESYGVAEGFVTSIHAMTPSLKPLDGLCLRGRHWRDHRSINQNIIPAVTGACKALGKIIPQVKDKMCGLAFRVPVINVSVLDITIRLNKNTTLKEIAERIEKERTVKMKNIIKTSYDEAVSSDFKNDENSCILDITSSLQLTPRSFKLVCWYENEYSYACRVVDTIMFCEEQCKLYILPIQGNIYDSKYTSICEKDENILRKINFENNLRMFNSISQGSGFKEKSKRKIGKEGFKSSHLEKKRFSSLNNNHKIIIDKYDSTEICEPGEDFHCITGKIERLAQVRKELAEITNRTDNLLKLSNHETLQKDNLKGWTIEKCMTNDNLMNTSKTNQVIISNNKNRFFETNKPNIIISNETTASLEAHNAIDLLKIVDQVVNKIDSKLLITDNDNLEDDIIMETKTRKENDGPKKSITDEAMNEINLQEKKTAIDEESTTIRDALLNNIMGNTIAITTLNENVKRTEEFTANNSKIISNENINIIDSKICNKSILNINQSDASIVITTSSSSDKHNSNTTKKVITKRIVSSFIKKLSKENNLVYGETSKAYNVNVEEKRKNDLFDKLESDTDSDESIKVYETKSQVLDVTDLSSSTDDLARLDKICRIIEISDDLSDQLFSALSLTKTSKDKKWSFKDLCEKIKLDDFCNKVFGQSI